MFLTFCVFTLYFTVSNIDHSSTQNTIHQLYPRFLSLTFEYSSFSHCCLIFTKYFYRKAGDMCVRFNVLARFHDNALSCDDA